MLGAWAGIGIAARSTWSESPMHPSDPKHYSKCHLTLPTNPDKTWMQDETVLHKRFENGGNG